MAFLGIDKHSIVSIGTYGQIKSAEAKRIFREGLVAMLEDLEPKVVLVYGAMPRKIFEGLTEKTKFIQYDDWTTHVKKSYKNSGSSGRCDIHPIASMCGNESRTGHSGYCLSGIGS